MLTHTPPEEAANILHDLVLSIHRTPIASVVADNLASDTPIVAVNSAFCELTGYAPDEVIGRNCRFLGGPATEPARRKVLRDALTGGQPVLTELTNYRKDGTVFRNAVMIAPVLSASGHLLYFIGSQMEVVQPGGTTEVRRQDAVSRLATLTRRQSQVLKLMTVGLRNKQIAVDLHIKEATVKLHRSLLLKKLGVKSSAEAVRVAVEGGPHLSGPTSPKV